MPVNCQRHSAADLPHIPIIWSANEQGLRELNSADEGKHSSPQSHVQKEASLMCLL